MRILLSSKSKRDLYSYLKIIYACSSERELALKMSIPYGTLKNWFQEEKRYLPERIIPENLMDKLEIIDKQKENWGSVIGGKKTYRILIRKYGLGEIRKRQSNGGKKSVSINRKKSLWKKPLLNDKKFLEFYGVLLGDGWIGRYKCKNKTISLIGISGDSRFDKSFLIYLKNNLPILFGRKGYLKNRAGNSIELQFSHKELLDWLSEEVDFPVGKKINLKIHQKIISLGFDKFKYVIRGIFDTDGSFYLDNTPSGNPYPCISIQMKDPRLINQMYNILISRGFRATYQKDNPYRHPKITLKGSKQLNKWMLEIGSMNKRHLDKINKFVPVAQLDSATPS